MSLTLVPIKAMSRKLVGDNEFMCLTADVSDNLIVAGYESGYLRVWDVRVDKNVPIISRRCGRAARDSDDTLDVMSVCFSVSDSNQFFAASGKYVHAVDMRHVDNCFKNSSFSAEDEINQLSVSENGELLAAADDDSVVSVFDLKSTKMFAKLQKHGSAVSSVEFRPGNSSELVSAGYDCYIMHWDVVQKQCLSSVDMCDKMDSDWKMPTSFNPSYVLSCAFGCPDETAVEASVVIAGTENGNLHSFRCGRTLLHTRSFRAHDLGVTKVCVCVPVNGAQKSVVTGSNDKTIKFWDLGSLLDSSTLQPQATNVIRHGKKINWLCSSCGYLVICDTSSDILLTPLSM